MSGLQALTPDAGLAWSQTCAKSGPSQARVGPEGPDVGLTWGPTCAKSGPSQARVGPENLDVGLTWGLARATSGSSSFTDPTEPAIVPSYARCRAHLRARPSISRTRCAQPSVAKLRRESTGQTARAQQPRVSGLSPHGLHSSPRPWTNGSGLSPNGLHSATATPTLARGAHWAAPLLRVPVTAVTGAAPLGRRVPPRVHVHGTRAPGAKVAIAVLACRHRRSGSCCGYCSSVIFATALWALAAGPAAERNFMICCVRQPRWIRRSDLYALACLWPGINFCNALNLTSGRNCETSPMCSKSE